MKTAVIFTIVMLEMSLSLVNMGPCGRKVHTDTSMEFHKFASENGGHWCQVIVPITSFTFDLQSVSYNLTQNNEREYTHSMFYTRRSGETGAIFTNRAMTDLGNGEAKSTRSKSKDSSNSTLRLSFLKYVPGHYAYFFICSCDGSDKSVDYRFVFAHDTLSLEETDEIMKIDRSHEFHGELMSIDKC